MLARKDMYKRRSCCGKKVVDVVMYILGPGPGMAWLPLLLWSQQLRARKGLNATQRIWSAAVLCRIMPANRIAFLSSFCHSIAALIPSHKVLRGSISVSPLAAAFVTTSNLVSGTHHLPSASCSPSNDARAQFPNSRTNSVSRRAMSLGAIEDESLTGFLGADAAAALDAELMASPGFSLEQLMELAGLSVAEAVYAAFPPIAHDGEKSRVVLVCGPGNNGGDGLVAARHLVHFGYVCVVVYPKKSQKTHFVNLVKQCEDLNIAVVDAMPDGWTEQFDVVVDAIFGFSFKGNPREPFATILKDIVGQNMVPVVSVDVPSGWNVDEGDVSGVGFMPDVLVSLTSPKLSSLKFTGRHFVGGRFLPPALSEKYGIRMPPYEGVSQVIEMPRVGEKDTAEEGWALQYAKYCAEKEAREQNDAARTEVDRASTQTVSAQSSTEASEDWGIEYDKYLAEKDKDKSDSDSPRPASEKNGDK